MLNTHYLTKMRFLTHSEYVAQHLLQPSQLQSTDAGGEPQPEPHPGDRAVQGYTSTWQLRARLQDHLVIPWGLFLCLTSSQTQAGLAVNPWGWL